MKFAVISDTHGQHDKVIIPDVDCLIHCGDISSMGTFSQVSDFMDWLLKVDVQTKIFVAGNHDFLLENDPNFGKLFLSPLTSVGIIYLNDSSIEFNGIKIHGSPMSPRFGNWAFMAERWNIKKHWDKIPNDTEILITHSPPQAIFDETVDGVNAGCEELSLAINRIKPKYHLFGHIHEGRGRVKLKNTEFINASCVDENYNFKHQPYEFEIETKALF